MGLRPSEYICLAQTESPRLSEWETMAHHELSLRRDLLAWARPSFAQTQSLAWTRIWTQDVTCFIATSLGRAILAWASGRVAQDQNWSLERDARTNTRDEFLQLSLRREWLAWAKISEFRLCSRI